MIYRTIVVDPPWAVKAGPAPLNIREGWLAGDGKSRDLAYPTMTVEEIKELPVGELAQKDAHLYLWTINAYVEKAYEVVRDWGFKPSTLLVWAKNPMGGGLGGTWGISTEFILFSRKGNLPATGRIKGTWFNWKRRYNARGKPYHSAKPSDFQDLVEQVSPGPYIELFARQRRPGWDVWGNEVDSDITFRGVR